MKTPYLFIAASVLLTLSPGPDIIFLITQGMAGGKRAGAITALGLSSGILVHTTLAVAGISAIFQNSPFAFRVLKIAGVFYLLFLAFRTVRERSDRSSGVIGELQSRFMLYKRAFLMNVLNPKVALFFLAFLPQFVIRENGRIALQMALLGLIFMAQVIIVFGAIGLFSGLVGSFLLKNTGISGYLKAMKALIFVVLAVSLFFT